MRGILQKRFLIRIIRRHSNVAGSSPSDLLPLSLSSSACHHCHTAIGALRFSSFSCSYPLSSSSLFHKIAALHHECRTLCSSPDFPPHQVISLPALSPTMAKGNIPSWSKKEGDKVSVGEVLCLIETDKSTMEMEAMEEGFLAKILVPGGSTDVAVGQPIAIIVEDEDDIVKAKNIAPPSSAAAPTEAKKAKKEDRGVERSTSKAPAIPSRQRLGPSVRKLLEESGIDVATVKGTGPGGSVLKGDVLEAMKAGSKPAKTAEPKKTEKTSLSTPISKGASPQSASASYEDLPTSQIRKIIAKRLLESKNGVPHLYLSSDTVIDQTLAKRKALKGVGVHVSVNDLIIQAVAFALQLVPEMNAYWDEKDGVVLKSSIDISIAVATEKGLMTPILHNADQRSISNISSEVKLLATKAREGKLQPHEFQGGSFSISNLGMFDVGHFCAIINPPQACILAVGRGEPSVEWQEDPTDPSKGKPKAVTKMILTLSADHRVVDAELGGRFLDKLASLLGDP